MTTANRQPAKLFHYTDAYGLKGIIEPSWSHSLMHPESVIGHHRAIRLLASDVRFMNDTEELKFGTRLLLERLRVFASDPATPEEFRIAFLDIEQYFDADRILEWPVTCYASCFCGNGDLLSQWRGYAGGTGGFALGIDRDALENRTWAFAKSRWPGDREMPSEPALRPVVYGEEAGIAAVDEGMRQLIDSNWTNLVTDRRPEVIGKARRLLFSMLVRSVATIKADAFSEEQEWRLFTLGEIDFPPYVRPRARGLVPYVEVAVNFSNKTTAKEHSEHVKAHPTIVDLVVDPDRNRVNRRSPRSRS